MIYKPSSNEYAEFYAGYVSRVPEDDILNVLESQIEVLQKTASTVSPDRETFAYEEGKWTIRQVFGHMNDGERVFGFRAFCFCRKEQQPLPGFEQNDYVSNATYHNTDLKTLVNEFALIRNANLNELRRIPDETWMQTGIASGKPVSVRALAYVMAGHVRHHLSVLAEKYQVRM